MCHAGIEEYVFFVNSGSFVRYGINKEKAFERIRALSQKYCLTVHLAANKNGEVLYIDKYDQPDFFIMYSQVGQTAPMTCTGLGKAMLAFEDENYLQKYILSKPFPVHCR